eukprot:CAMPEP_0169146978 /NCGR_PEP_ID=MMETSP1015-20121227/47935_1 /TAXON_ID=342587 /ORGANISM="Karlodinium micrum, Strain CCMP2283" /LENGTH=132 /DNA_ID=CAMNT_0009215075 /DNA_START=342 /DNA_END=741 /DNA_ORIENTATION=-
MAHPLAEVPCESLKAFTVAAFHSIAVSSRDAVNTLEESAEKAACFKPPPCPTSVNKQAFHGAFQSFAVRSSDEVTIMVLSAENTAEVTVSACGNVCKHSHDSASQILAVQSSELVRASAPSCESTAENTAPV